MCQKALDMMCERALSRETQGSLLADKQSVQNYVADSYAQLMQFRLFVLYVAWEIDEYQDYRRVRHDIAAIKVLTPQVLHDIVQRSIQVHGALGVSNEMPLGRMWMMAPVMGLVDGPSEVHRVTVARQVLKRYQAAPGLWPTEHLPEKIAAAREKFAEYLELEVANLSDGHRTRPGARGRRRRRRTRSGPGGSIDEALWRPGWTSGASPGPGAPFEATFITGGASNELFEIRRGGHRMALRRPPGSSPQGRNETMLREYRLLAALADTDVPHARALAVCDDPELMGGCFYLMEYVDGWSPLGGGGWPAPFDTDPEGRRGLAFQLVDGIAKLAKVDWEATGTGRVRPPRRFHERQVDRWMSHLAAVQFRDIPGLDEAAEWLRSHQPRHYRPGIMHGDYQFANVMFRHGAPAGWPPSWTGRWPPWATPCSIWAGSSRAGSIPDEERRTGSYVDYSDMPSRAELLDYYAAESGRPDRRHRLLRDPGPVQAGRRPRGRLRPGGAGPGRQSEDGGLRRRRALPGREGG